MFISVVLPAPFSPTMPWMVPRATARSMSRLATVAPKLLPIPRRATAGALSSIVRAVRAVLFRHVVGDLDPSGDDVGLRRLRLRRHLCRDQRGVVVVDRVADAVFGEAEYLGARLPAAVARRFEGEIDRIVDALDHRGQNRARMQVVLVGIAADG